MLRLSTPSPPMSLLKPTAALVAALALGGCDRFEEPAFAPPVVAGPAAAGPAIYVKGTPSVTVGVGYEFRAQAIEGAVMYGWSAVGTGTAIVNTNGNARIVTVTGTRPGAAVVRATAYDAAEREIASGRREIVVVE